MEPSATYTPVTRPQPLPAVTFPAWWDWTLPELPTTAVDRRAKEEARRAARRAECDMILGRVERDPSGRLRRA